MRTALDSSRSVFSTSNQAPVVQRSNSYFLSSGYNRYTKDNIFRLASFRLFEAWICRVIQPGAIQRIKLKVLNNSDVGAERSEIKQYFFSELEACHLLPDFKWW